MPSYKLFGGNLYPGVAKVEVDENGDAVKQRLGNTVPIGYGEPETVEKLRFSDNLCFDFAKHGRPKVPMRKLSPSGSKKTEAHVLGFFAFAQQTLLNARCRAAASAS